MDKEKNKLEKKRGVKSCSEGEIGEKKTEMKILNKGITSDGNHTSKEEKEKREFWSSNEELSPKGRVSLGGFYIAHPKSIKRTAHFKDVHSKKLAELLEVRELAFHMFDFDRDGVIDHSDLKKTFASLCVEASDEEIDQMLSEGLNPLNFDAFVILLGHKTLDLDPEEVMLDALSNWDEHLEGLVSLESLKLHLMAWGDKFTEEEALSALKDAPVILNKTKERMIDYVQFCEDLCGLRKMMQKKPNQ